MPYRRKDSPIWWVSYTDASGKRIRQSTATTDRKEADALETKWKLEVYRTKKWNEQPSRTFDELMLVYIKEVEKKSSERDYFSLKRLYPYFSGRSINTLCAAEVREYINLRRADGVGAGTINKEIGLLRAAINYANREWGWNLPNTVRGRTLKEPSGRIRWISMSEAAALIQSAQQEPKAPHLADFIHLGLHTAMRRGEILGLEWRRVDFQKSLVYLEAQHQKNGKIGSVPLNRTAHTALLSRERYRAQHCPHSPWVFCNKEGRRIQSIRRSFLRACERVGLDDFHPHDLRHTCAAWLVQAGVSIREVAELLRHSDISMTMRYAHLAPENVRAAVALLEKRSHDPVTLAN